MLKLKINVNLPQLLCIVISAAENGEFERFGGFSVDCYYTSLTENPPNRSNRSNSATHDLYAFFTYIFSKQPFFGLRLLLLQCGVWFLGELFLTNTTNKFLSAAFPFESRVLCHYYVLANSSAFPGVS